MDVIVIESMQELLANDNTKVLYYFGVLVTTSLLDFVMGTVIAKFSKEIKFSSNEMKKGLMYKVFIIIVSMHLLPVCLMFSWFGMTALYTVYSGFIISDLYSIYAHLTGNKDGKKNLGIKAFFEILENRKKDD